MIPKEVLKALVEIPSYLQKNQEGKVVRAEEEVLAFIENFLKQHNIFSKIQKQEVRDGRYNLIACNGNENSELKLLFCCHVDTVEPKEGQLTSAGRCSVVESDGKIFGLGAVDMKGGIAALLAVLSELGDCSAKDLGVLFYCDEEYDFLGMKKMAEDGKLKAGLVVFCEPTDLQIINGCRGLIEISGYVRGVTGHPSRPRQGLNAISLAKAAFDLLEFRVNRYVHPDMGQSVCNLAAIDGGLEKIREGSRIVIGREGNNIPNICHVVIEARTTMEELDAFELITIYKNLIREGGGHFKMEKLRHNFGSFFSKEEDLKLIKKAAREVCGSAFYGDISQAGYYDAQLLLEKQPMPCAIFGPGPKLAAHQKDEHVSIESLDKTAKTYKRLMELCGVI